MAVTVLAPRWVAALALCVALAGCGADPAPGDAEPAPDGLSVDDVAADGTVDPDALEAWRAAVAAMPADEVQDRAGAASLTLERELYELSGLTEALGGADAADASIEASAEWLAALASTEGGGAARPAPFAARPVGRRASASQGLGEGFLGGMFGALTLAGSRADLAQATTEKAAPGAALPEGVRVDPETGRVTSTITKTLDDPRGATSRVSAETAAAPCPEADGTFRTSASTEFSSTVAQGRTGARVQVEVEIVGAVGEQAQLVGYDLQMRGQVASFVDGRGGFLDFSASYPQDGSRGGLRVNRSGGTLTDTVVKSAVDLTALLASAVGAGLVEASRKAWESGRCVRLDTTVSAGPSGLEPSSTVTITAMPRSKVDQSKAGGTVTAVMAGGAASVSPASAPADATFTYTAPGERDRTGSVALESRSRRGVGRATLDFDTKQRSYTASGGGEVSFSGTVTSLTGPFELTGTFPGGTATFRFDGAREDGGSVEVSGGGSGATLTGGGSYTVADAGGGALLLTARVRSCVDVSRICRSTTHPIRLTPRS